MISLCIPTSLPLLNNMFLAQANAPLTRLHLHIDLVTYDIFESAKAPMKIAVNKHSRYDCKLN